jgi:Spy/CpxP family protein refolding chaperone
MNLSYFLISFGSALVLVVIILAAIYFYLKWYRGGAANIKGYLDLIPDLTEQQRALVQDIREVFLPKVEDIRQNMRSKRAELAELLFDESADRSEIYALVEQIIGYQSQLEREVIEHILEEKEILTATQKRKFYQIIVEQFASGGLGVHDLRARN